MDRVPYRPGLYSRLVGLLKVALPLVAVALMATVFLVQKEDKITGGVVFTQGDRDTMRDGLAINNPELSGITATGDRFFMTAVRAIPDGNTLNEVALERITARTEYLSGRKVYLKAHEGTAFVPEQRVHLMGDIEINTTDGYVGVTQTASADLANGEIFADSPVVIDGPTGRLEAGSMRITNEPDATGARNNQMFTFENGVKLTFQPGAPG